MKYRLDRRHALQIFGWRMVAAAVLVLVGVVSLGGLPPAIGGICLALAAVSVLWATLTLLRPPLIIALTESGYRLGRVPNAGTKNAYWTEVDKVEAQESPAGLLLTFTLEDRPDTLLPLTLVAHTSAALQRDINARLNAAHGYRPLP